MNRDNIKFTIISIFPEMLQNALREGVVGQALHRKNLISVDVVNPRLFTEDKHRSVDDSPLGGGDGMVMLTEVLEKTYQHICMHNESLRSSMRFIYLSPQGQKLTHQKVQNLTQYEHIILLSGRYGGVDQRFLDKYVDEEISIGDYVLSGGELPALVLIDAVTRQLPNVLGHAQSAMNDSFVNGLLEGPSYTRPQNWQEQTVPEVLISGHHKNIKLWREELSLLFTLDRRPDLIIESLRQNHLSLIQVEMALKNIVNYKSVKFLNSPLQLKELWEEIKQNI